MDCMNCGNRLGPGVKFCPRCGAAAPAAGSYGQEYAAAPTPPAGEQMHSSYGAAAPARGVRWGKVLLIVLGVLVVLGAAVGVAGYFGYKFVERQVKESEPYRLAMDELRRNPQAAELLGEIKETGFPLGRASEQAGGTGSAVLSITVRGTKARATYVVTMTREGGVWRTSNSFLRTDDGRVVQLSRDPVAVADPDSGDEPPPPPSLPPRPNAPVIVDAGPLDDKALEKPAPAYPAIARLAKASGTVTVKVTVDERGQVIAASAVSGHPLLRASAVEAARRARFPTSERPAQLLRVMGTLTYEFRPE